MLLTLPRFAQLAMGLGLLIGLVGSAPVRASDITFDLTSGVGGESTVSKTVSGYTMTLTPTGTNSAFSGDSDGLGIGSFGADSYVNGFQIQVTGGSLSFLNYTVGYIGELPANPFALTGGTGTSNNNTLATTGLKNLQRLVFHCTWPDCQFDINWHNYWILCAFQSPLRIFQAISSDRANYG